MQQTGGPQPAEMSIHAQLSPYLAASLRCSEAERGPAAVAGLRSALEKEANLSRQESTGPGLAAYLTARIRHSDPREPYVLTILASLVLPSFHDASHATYGRTPPPTQCAPS